MTVEQLIRQLEKVKDKTRTVCFAGRNGITSAQAGYSIETVQLDNDIPRSLVTLRGGRYE